MSKLIDEFKKEHLLISDTLNKVKNYGIVTKEAQDKLLEVKNELLSHLKKEDEQLYPFLRNKAESDANLKNTLDIFANNMNEISKAAMIFFEKYAKGGSGIEFARDVGKLYATLKERISKEESIIYAKYEELK